MPTYLYVCPDRHFKTEVTHSITVEPILKCEICEKELNRQPQLGAIKFNGNGFYTTDKNESK